MNKKSLKEVFNKNWNYIVSIFFFVWWIFDLKLKLIVYNGHEYLWFCSFALLFISIAFFLRNSTILSMVLSISLAFQLFWIVDFFGYLITHTIFTQNIKTVFDVGYTFPDFLSALRHLFMIPFALLGLRYFGKPKSYAYLLNASYFIIIGIPSYFMTNIDENLNCTLKSCFSLYGSATGLWTYSFPFLIKATTICAFIVNPIVNWLIHKCYDKKEYMKILNAITIIFFIIAIIGSSFGYLEYSKTPHYLCNHSEKNIICERAYTDENGRVYVAYYFDAFRGENCSISVYSSNVILNSTSETITLTGQHYGIVYVELPKVNTYVNLSLNCNNV